MASTAEVLAKLSEANTRLDTITTEIIALKDAIAAGATPEEVATAVDVLLGKITVADDLNP